MGSRWERPEAAFDRCPQGAGLGIEELRPRVRVHVLLSARVIVDGERPDEKVRLVGAGEAVAHTPTNLPCFGVCDKLGLWFLGRRRSVHAQQTRTFRHRS